MGIKPFLDQINKAYADLINRDMYKVGKLRDLLIVNGRIVRYKYYSLTGVRHTASNLPVERSVGFECELKSGEYMSGQVVSKSFMRRPSGRGMQCITLQNGYSTEKTHEKCHNCLINMYPNEHADNEFLIFPLCQQCYDYRIKTIREVLD